MKKENCCKANNSKYTCSLYIHVYRRILKIRSLCEQPMEVFDVRPIYQNV